MSRRRAFASGAAEIAPILVAASPIGLLWGTLATGKGLSLFEAVLMSALVFAGAAQFVAIEMWHDPVPVLLVTFTVFIVNARHILMSASLSRHIEAIPRALHPLVAFLMVDESWALSEKRALSEPVTLPYYLGLSLPMVACWTVSTGVGAMLGRSLGDPAAIGLDFAFSALFVSILMGFWKGRSTALILTASGAAAVLAKFMLPGAWYIVAGGLAGALCAALLHRDEA
ncbi:AzlC family ABC transporter permease [Aestuariivirga sp.]|uniref:AzlC family ABC transporter permease n=1 Tax=Aestuariivirga sp. TaxID=2650926 RepID=UPI0035930CCF